VVVGQWVDFTFGWVMSQGLLLIYPPTRNRA